MNDFTEEIVCTAFDLITLESTAMVPEAVIGPPVSPVPVKICVIQPLEPLALSTPVVELMLRPAPTLTPPSTDPEAMGKL